MTEQYVPVPRAADDSVPEKLPAVFRLQAIERLPFDRTCIQIRATLFHEKATIRVEWLSPHTDQRLMVGKLVAIRWFGRPVSANGSIRIARLAVFDLPDRTINLFETIPRAWVKDRTLVKRAMALWSLLPLDFAHLFNAMLWESGRFLRYLTGPSSLKGHHHDLGGNFRHSVEVAERALNLAKNDRCACSHILVLAALIHDAGKADEYRKKHDRLEMSDRGRLIGHRHTIIEWIAAAKAQYHIRIPEEEYLGLMHALTAAKAAPAWLGMREPQSLDATLLQVADSVSGKSSLVQQCASTTTGFGAYHPHLGVRPYVVRPRASG